MALLAEQSCSKSLQLFSSFHKVYSLYIILPILSTLPISTPLSNNYLRWINLNLINNTNYICEYVNKNICLNPNKYETFTTTEIIMYFIECEFNQTIRLLF